MGIPVVLGATWACTMGTGPGQLVVTSQSKVMLSKKPVATVADAAPMSNLNPAGLLCTSLANPTVASATAAALGVLTPMPCIPAPSGGWVCSGTPQVCGPPMLTTDGFITCMYGGSISIVNPGQSSVLIK